MKRLFNFFRSKNKVVSSSNFTGRHQQSCITREFLGEVVPRLELQIAINKDAAEHAEIIKKLEEIEKYISSDLFTNYLDVESVNKDVRDLIGEGHRRCILTNDTALENRCFKILEDTHKYLQSYLNKEDKVKGDSLAGLSERLKSLLIVEAIVSYLSLGGLLKNSSEEQWAWMIINSVHYSNNLIKMASSLLPPEPALNGASKLRDFAIRLQKKNKINKDNLKKIENEINEGLLLGKENYK